MSAPINAFETVESIRFFASLVGTEGVSEEVREKVNDYLLRLVNSLEKSVQETTAASNGLHLV